MDMKTDVLMSFWILVHFCWYFSIYYNDSDILLTRADESTILLTLSRPVTNHCVAIKLLLRMSIGKHVLQDFLEILKPHVCNESM